MSEDIPPDTSRSVDNEEPNKNIFTRKLPKPVVIGFFSFLALVVLIQLLLYADKKYKETQEAERQAIEQFEARQQAMKDRELLRKIGVESVIVREELQGGGFVSRRGIADPILDDPQFEGLTVQTLKRYFELDASLLRRKSESGISFAHAAIIEGRADLLECLIEHEGAVDQPGPKGLTPLQLVVLVWANAEDLDDLMDHAKLLLAAGADPNRATNEQGSPTAIAAKLEDKRMFTLLQKHGGEYQFDPLNP